MADPALAASPASKGTLRLQYLAVFTRPGMEVGFFRVVAGVIKAADSGHARRVPDQVVGQGSSRPLADSLIGLPAWAAARNGRGR
jgi:hypothetical protein